MPKNYLLVLAQSHRDPLSGIRKLRKIECFSGKRFKELKEIFRGYCNDRKLEAGTKTSKALHFREVRAKIPKDKKGYKAHHTGESYNSPCIASNSSMIWWNKENWKDIRESENLWGDLGIAEEELLRSLLKGSG